MKSSGFTVFRKVYVSQRVIFAQLLLHKFTRKFTGRSIFHIKTQISIFFFRPSTF